MRRRRWFNLVLLMWLGCLTPSLVQAQPTEAPAAPEAVSKPLPPAATPSATPVRKPGMPPAPLVLETAQEIQARQDLRKTELTHYLLKMILALAAVCALAWLILRWILPRITGQGPRRGTWLQIVQRFPLEPRKSLFLVRIGANYHLLGVSDHSINYLMQVESALVNANPDKPLASPPHTFLDILDRKTSTPPLPDSGPSLSPYKLDE